MLLSLFPNVLFAKAYYAGKKEMIEKAEAIIIIEITNIENVTKKGQHWIYGQKAIGTVEKTLKGDIQNDIVIYGMEDFICAQCRFEKGRFLLFLCKDNDLWAGSNWQLGIRPIKNGKIDWFKNDESRFDMEEKSFVDVIKEIENIIENNRITRQSTGPNSPPSAAP